MPKRKQAEAGEADGPMAEGQVVPIRRSSRQQAKASVAAVVALVAGTGIEVSDAQPSPATATGPPQDAPQQATQSLEAQAGASAVASAAAKVAPDAAEKPVSVSSGSASDDGEGEAGPSSGKPKKAAPKPRATRQGAKKRAKSHTNNEDDDSDYDPYKAARAAKAQEDSASDYEPYESDIDIGYEDMSSDYEPHQEARTPGTPAGGSTGRAASKKRPRPESDHEPDAESDPPEATDSLEEYVSHLKMCASRARKLFGLKESDLAQLTCVLKRNPYYRCAAPMRLYSITELQALAEAKPSCQHLAEGWRAEVQKLAMAKKEKADSRKAAAKKCAARRRAEAQALAEAAAKQVQAFAKHPAAADLPGGNTPMPIDAWALVLQSLVIARWDDPIQGILYPMQSLCTAALTCRDLASAAREALQVLATQPRVAAALEPAAGGPGPVPEHLSKAVSTPLDLKLPELKEVCKALGCGVTGTKPVLTLRVLEAMGLKAPMPNVPAVFLWLSRHQHRTRAERDPELVSIRPHLMMTDFWWYSASTDSMCAFRAAVRALGVEDLSDLHAREALIRAQREAERRKAKEKRQRRIAQAAAEQARRAELIASGKLLPQNGIYKCECGNTASPKCALLKCSQCCTGPCIRHNRR